MPDPFGLRARTAAAAALAASLLAGCWVGDASSRVPVDGMVILDRKPLESGAIEFDLEVSDPKQAFHSGAAIRNGRFFMPAEDGLIPGRYRVWIHGGLVPKVRRPGEPPPPRAEGQEATPRPVELVNRIPERYATTDRLTAEIKPGWFNSLTFVLEP